MNNSKSIPTYFLVTFLELKPSNDIKKNHTVNQMCEIFTKNHIPIKPLAKMNSILVNRKA